MKDNRKNKINNIIMIGGKVKFMSYHLKKLNQSRMLTYLINKTMNTKVNAYKRLLQGKATKSDFKVLIKWAKTEINEWAEFLKFCDKKLKQLTRD